jgi:hypothetical protein
VMGSVHQFDQLSQAADSRAAQQLTHRPLLSIRERLHVDMRFFDQHFVIRIQTKHLPAIGWQDVLLVHIQRT